MAKETKILLVDDQEDFIALLSFWLKSKGYIVLTAANGKIGVEMVQKESPDIVFLDIHMPVMSGPETLKEIRKLNKDLPVILISAHTEDPSIKELYQYGISGVFNKVANFEDALPLIEEAIKRVES